MPWSRPRQQRYAGLGCTVLGYDPFQLYSQSNLSLFATLIPQLTQSSPSVNAAVAAFGAAYDSAYLRSYDSLAYDDATTQYGLALKLLQLELNQPEPQYTPVLITSTLLAAAETVQARQKGALAHVLGAFGIFMNRQSGSRSLPSAAGSNTGLRQRGLPADIIDMLEHMCLSIDLLVATFTWGDAPHLPPQPFSEATFNPKNVDHLCQELPKLLHASMHFMAEVSHEVTRESTDLSFDLVFKQSSMIGWLQQWLTSFSVFVDWDNSNLQRPRYRHLMLLKAQCLTMFLAVSNVRALSQISWDKFGPEFEEIVRCAEVVLDEAGHYVTSTKSPLQPFCPCLGIIPPLFSVARRYRHSAVRRRAISLLRLTGFEGPFSGDFEADLAIRFVEIEEGRPFDMHLPEDQVMNPAEIPDYRRICYCYRLSERYEFDDRVIKFARRRKAAYEEQEPVTALFPADDDTDRWDVWKEIIRSFKRRSEEGDPGSAPIEAGQRWISVSGEAKDVHEPMRMDHLSRDPDWVKSAVRSRGLHFFDHPHPLRWGESSGWGCQTQDKENFES